VTQGNGPEIAALYRNVLAISVATSENAIARYCMQLFR